MTAAEAVEELRALATRAGGARAREAVKVLARLVAARTAASRRHEEKRGLRSEKYTDDVDRRRGRRHGLAGKPREPDASDAYLRAYERGEQERLS